MIRVLLLVLAAFCAPLPAAAQLTNNDRQLMGAGDSRDGPMRRQYFGGRAECTAANNRAEAAELIIACTRAADSERDRALVGRFLITRGDLHFDIGDQAAAAADYQQAVDIYTDLIASDATPRALSTRAAALFRLERFEEALANYDRALAIDPHFASALNGRGITSFRRGDYTSAIADFDRTVELAARLRSRGGLRTPSRTAIISPAVHANQCAARAAARIELDVARAACETAIRGSAEHVFSRGFLNFIEGRLEEALQDFDRAAALSDTNGSALYARGVVATRLGRTEAGEADMARGREMEGSRLDYYINAGLVP